MRAWNARIRQAHRWMAVAFTLLAGGIFAALGMGREPAEWAYFLPLAPLFLSGAWMFALPYVTRRRREPG